MNRQDPLHSNTAVPASHTTTQNSNLENNATYMPVVWLDKQDVLQRLHISPRTLQNWRSRGLLPYYKVEGKIWYKEEI